MEISNKTEYFFGNNLRFLRKSKKMTLLGLSETLKISKSAISDYEIGKTLPRKKTELRDYHIGEFVTERMETLDRQDVPKREIRQRAIDAACKEFGVMDTVVTDALTYWKRLEAALDEDASS